MCGTNKKGLLRRRRTGRITFRATRRFDRTRAEHGQAGAVALAVFFDALNLELAVLQVAHVGHYTNISYTVIRCM